MNFELLITKMRSVSALRRRNVVLAYRHCVAHTSYRRRVKTGNEKNTLEPYVLEKHQLWKYVNKKS